MAKLTLGVFGDAGNSFYNASAYYYKPGWYEIYRTGGTAPVQASVAEMIRSWGVSELIQLGDTAYNAQSSTLLDNNIGKYYNDYMQPYGNRPDEFAYADPDGPYATAEGGVIAVPGKTQWPYNLYNFPDGFPNPSDPEKAPGSNDGHNHFWALQGNHDYGTIIGTYNDVNVNQANRDDLYIGYPEGPDVYDYQNNIIKGYQPEGSEVPAEKIGSAQQLLDYLPYLLTGDDPTPPSYLKPGQVRIGSNDPRGYDGIYYSVDLGETSSGGVTRALLHVVMLDTPRIMTDAGYYDFNGKKKKKEAEDRIAQTGDQSLKAKNYLFDPTESSQIALFPDPDAAPTDPSASYEMFQWVKQDLKESNAVWNVVAGHHTSYHGGAVSEDANSNNFSSPIMVKFLAGLKDDKGVSLIDAYMNGHSHAYSRALEMGPSQDGIGPGIPLLTTGNGGKDQDPLNLVPYGENVLIPQNWLNTFTKADGTPGSNAEINGLNDPYLAAFPQGANPTSVGTSGYYRYNVNNIPQGTILSSKPKDDAGLLASYKKTIVVSDATRNPEAKTKEFEVTIPQYNSLLPGSTDADSAVSGLYGYGSGAEYVEVDDGYLFMNYRTAVPLDPAITLIGRQKGLSVEQMQRGSLFFEQWSPSNAKVDNLALFSFDVIIDAAHPEGSLDHLQLVQAGNGYLEQAIGSNTYQDGTYTLEIQGNNPITPLASDQSDPSRAAVELTFQAGQLTSVRFAKDADGKDRQGTGYKELANAINGNNYNRSSEKSLLVGININLEAQYTFADQAPSGSDLYQDWYLMAETEIQSSSRQQGPYGGLNLGFQPSAPRARQIIATQPLTTGYSGSGPQAAYAKPLEGLITITDQLANTVAGGATLSLKNGTTGLRFSQLPAPGPVRVDFGGDPYSSYQVNYKAASTSLNLSYGNWDAGLSSGPDQTLTFSSDVVLNVTRSDSAGGRMSFGLRGEGDNPPVLLLQNADPASASALDVNRLFIASGTGSWLASEGQAQGSTAATMPINAGTWRPVAYDSNGNMLAAQSITLSGNTAQVDFVGGFQARYSTPGTGTADALPKASNLVLSVKRLAGFENGLALYEADPVTGAIQTATGQMLMPGQSGYLQAALDHASQAGLRLTPEQLPQYGSEKIYKDLPLMADRNYGLLLLRNNDVNDLASSYSQANSDGLVRFQSFATPGRGISYGVEDHNDHDFNDFCVTLTGSSVSIV